MKITFIRQTLAIFGFLVWVMVTLPTVHADEYETIRETLETCATCHGEKGLPKEDNIPILAGQELYYIYVQLKDIKKGLRKSELWNHLLRSWIRQY